MFEFASFTYNSSAVDLGFFGRSGKYCQPDYEAFFLSKYPETIQNYFDLWKSPRWQGNIRMLDSIYEMHSWYNCGTRCLLLSNSKCVFFKKKCVCI